jgi:putative ABC transport system permease protein
MQGLRLAIRSLRTTPIVTAAAILSLALGIGVNTAMFSVVNAVLFRRAPYPAPDRVLMLVNTFDGRVAVSGMGVSVPKFVAWRNATTALEDVAAYTFDRRLDTTDVRERRAVLVGSASLEFFRLFGIQVRSGRTFLAAEDQPAGPHVAVVTDRFCRRIGATLADAVGRTVSIDGRPFVIVGVIDGKFDTERLSAVATERPDIWLPLQLDPNVTDNLNYLLAAGRLRPGVSLASAQAQTAAADRIVREALPAVLPSNTGLAIERLDTMVVQNARTPLLVLWMAVALVLLIACANAASLQSVRGAARAHEIGIRLALGASRGRIVRDLLTESLILAMVGACLGTLIAAVGVRTSLAAYTGGSQPFRFSDIALFDVRVLVFTAAITAATTILFGVVPAVRTATSKDAVHITRSGGDPRATRFGGILVVSEMALAIVLLIGSVLLIRSFIHLRQVDPGVDTHHVLTVQTGLLSRRLADSTSLDRMVTNGLTRLSAVPEIDVATATIAGVPLESRLYLNVHALGRPRDDLKAAVGWFPVAPRYFETLRIPLRRGRVFNERDTRRSPSVVIINQTMATKYWPHGNPIGERMMIGETIGGEAEETVPRQVVGVVADVHDQGLSRAPLAAVYVPLTQLTDRQAALFNRFGLALTWIVRTTGESERLVDDATREIRTATDLPVERVRTMESISEASTTEASFELRLMGLFAAVALVLAAVGVFGVLNYVVEQQRHEFGVRLALGAHPGWIVQLVLGRASRWLGAGIAIGIVLAMWAGRFLAALLYAVQPSDPLALAVASITLAGIGAAAAWLPAWRASQIDPAEVLRET